jgi:hypothetical protein
MTVYPWPDEIYMRDLPINLCGWNSTLRKTDEIKEGAPMYIMNPYYMYGMIYILGIKVFKRDGIWVMTRFDNENEDNNPIMTTYGNLPFGRWTTVPEIHYSEGYVSDQYTYTADQIVFACIGVAVVTAALVQAF